MAETVRGVNLLQHELEKAKESLKDVDENIKKLTGRDPTEQRAQQRTGPQRRVTTWSGSGADVSNIRGRDSRIDNRLFNLARRGIMEEGPSPAKRRAVGGAFARLGPRPRPERAERPDSGDEDDLPNKPSVQSSVVATPKEIRTRQKSIDEQSKDSEGRARNRRMFGHIIGTLRRFKDDAKTTKEKEEQRKEIEKKLDEKFKQEKDEIIKERKQLFEERKQKQIKIRLLEQKMELAENHENWERETRKLEHFIRTKAKPCIYYMPKSLTAVAQTKLNDSKKIIDKIIEDQRKKLEEEIEELMSHAAKLDDGDDKMEEDGGDSEDGEIRDKKYGENKENKRDRKASGRDRKDSQHDNDKDRKDRSLDRKDSSHADRRDSSRDKKDRDIDREHSDRNRRSSKDDSNSRDRRRSSSGKGHSDRRTSGEHSDRDEKSHSHHSKSKRRSRGEIKSERKEKVWEPMEDEDEDYEDDIQVVRKDEEKEKDDILSSKSVIEREDGEVVEGIGGGVNEKEKIKMEHEDDDGLAFQVKTEVKVEPEDSDSITISDKLMMPEDTEMDYEGDHMED